MAADSNRGFANGIPFAHTAVAEVFIISVFLAILALLVRYAHAAVPVVSNYTFETLLVGHGEPLVGGASAAVAELGAAG